MFTEADIDGFARAAHSLKLYRRAEVRDDDNNKDLIEDLYVDPLMNNAVLEIMLRDSTTFLVGRKGSGKSTVFQRTQHALRKRQGNISAYVDIKTVYEASEVDQSTIQQLQKAGLDPNEESLRRIVLYRGFIKAVLSDVREELKRQVTGGALSQILSSLGLRKSDITAELNELLEGSFEFSETDISSIRQIKTVENVSSAAETRRKNAAGIKATAGQENAVSADLGAEAENKQQTARDFTQEYSNVIVRTVNITNVLERLNKILKTIGINKLYIFIDDFSELPHEAMQVFVDFVLAPLNNWSHELVKFKVAAYPGRVYLGKIDPTKIDTINLDMFRLYGESDVSTMEDKAVDFTKRLVESRFSYFVKQSFSSFLEGDEDAVYRQLFYATMANPRILGHVLSYLRDSTVAYGRQIGVRAIQDASLKYYQEKIEPFFGIQKFALESFEERASTFSLKELLEDLVHRARILRDYKDSKVTQEIRGRTPSSHFHVADAMESVLATLELNFFITMYYQQKDRDGNEVIVYALNHGLCQKFNLAFGRPSGQREHRLYYVERIFDYTGILRKFLERNQEIRCENCGSEYGLDVLESLRFYGMLCPTCKSGHCQVINLSKKYEKTLREIDPYLLLPSTELGILETLYTEKRDMVAAEIAGELDCSYQLIGKRGRNLADRGLVARGLNDEGRRIFNITGAAQQEYFSNNAERELNIDPE